MKKFNRLMSMLLVFVMLLGLVTFNVTSDGDIVANVEAAAAGSCSCQHTQSPDSGGCGCANGLNSDGTCACSNDCNYGEEDGEQAKTSSDVHLVIYNSKDLNKSVANARIATDKYVGETISLPTTLTQYYSGSYEVVAGPFNDGGFNAYKSGGNATASTSLEITGKWQNVIYVITNTHTVAYYKTATDKNAGTSAAVKTTSAREGTILPTADAPTVTRDGYKFLYWMREGTSIDVATSSNKTVNGWTNLVAAWSPITYTIDYNYSGGSAPTSPAPQTTYTIESETITLKEPTRDGYTFLGWYKTTSDGTSSEKVTSIPKGSTGNLTLTAKWKENTAQHQITFAVNVKDNYNLPVSGVTVTVSGKVNGSNFTATAASNANGNANPVKYWTTAYTGEAKLTDLTVTVSVPNGYVANYTTTTLADTTKSVSDSSTINIPTVVLTKLHTVTFVSENETYKTETVKDGETVTAPTAPTREGYSFDYWMDNDGGEYNFNESVTGDITLTAKWTAIEYTLTYDYNGGTYTVNEKALTSSYSTYKGTTTVTIKGIEPVRDGYTFLGWATTADATEAEYTAAQENVKLDFDSTNKATLYAVWQANKTPADFRVTFTVRDIYGNLIEGAEVRMTVSGVNGEAVSSDALKATTGEDGKATINTTFNVVGGKIESVNYSYSVTKDGYNNYNSESTRSGCASATRDVALTPTELTICSSLYINGADKDHPVMMTDVGSNGNYAWTCRYSGNYGAAIDYDAMKAALVNAALKADSTNKPNTSKYDLSIDFPGTNNSVESDVTTFGDEDATWQIGNKYTAYFWGRVTLYYDVTFDLNYENSAEATTQTIKFGEVVAAPTAPTRTGYTFLGWFVDEECKEAYNFNSEVTNSFTLYAGWQIKTYTICSDLRINGNDAFQDGKTCAWTYRYGDEYGKTIDYTNMFAALKAKALEADEANGPVGADIVLKHPGTDKVFNTSVSTYGDTAAAWNSENNTAYIWGYATMKYKVTFNTNGGSAVDDQIIAYGGEVTPPADPTRENTEGNKVEGYQMFTFDGWYTDPEFTEGTKVDFDNFTVERSVTLYAKWKVNAYTGIVASSAVYDVQYYEEELDGTYKLVSTVRESGKIGTDVDASELGLIKEASTGFHYNADKSTSTGEITNVTTDEDGAPVYLVLELYYDRNVYTFHNEGSSGVTFNELVTTYVTYDPDKVVGFTFKVDSGYADTSLQFWSGLGSENAMRKYTTGEIFGSYDENGALTNTPIYNAETDTYSFRYSIEVLAERGITDVYYKVTASQSNSTSPEDGKFKVVFHTMVNDGTVTKLVAKNAKVDDSYVLDGVSKENQHVYAWYTDKDFTQKYDFNTPVTADLDLYAKWVDDYVSVNVNDLVTKKLVLKDSLPSNYSETYTAVLFEQVNPNAKIAQDPRFTCYGQYKNLNAISVLETSYKTMRTDKTYKFDTSCYYKYLDTRYCGALTRNFNVAEGREVLTFGEAGTYTYYVHELSGKTKNMSYDTQWKKITIVVTEKEGVLSYKVTQSATITNVYDVQTNFTDADNSSVTLTKVDSADKTKTLSGAKFKLYQKGKYSDYEYYNTYTTSYNGEFTVYNLAAGDYYFVEVSAPVGYVLDSTPIEFTIGSTKKTNDVELTVTNKKVNIFTEEHFAYIQGYEDGTVRPQNNMTRAEAATILFRLLDDSVRSLYWDTGASYADVSGSAWYNNAVATLENMGVLESGINFRPNDYITRGELANMIANFYDMSGLDISGVSFTDISGHAYETAIKQAAAMGWVKGYTDGSFNPDACITRAEVVTMINRVLGRAVQERGMAAGMKTFPDNLSTAWYYADVQEATNSHTYTRTTTQVSGYDFYYESWGAIQANPDWSSLETTWAN